MASRIRSSSRWQRYRAWHKCHFPLCCDPLGRHRGMPVPNDAPNHVEPLYRAPRLAFVLENVAPCCTACNNAVDAMERKGLDVKPLFEAWRVRAKAFLEGGEHGPADVA